MIAFAATVVLISALRGVEATVASRNPMLLVTFACCCATLKSVVAAAHPDGIVEVALDESSNAPLSLAPIASSVCPSKDDMRFAEIASEKEIEYRRPTLMHSTFLTWSSMEPLLKLPYLLDRVDFSQLVQDFRYMFKVYHFNNDHNNIKNFDESKDSLFCASKEVVTSFLSEFRDPKHIEQFWLQCNTNSDSVLSLSEYIVCRDHFDVYANFGDNGEYARRESILISDFETKLRSSAFQPDIYTYDENGMIVD